MIFNIKLLKIALEIKGSGNHYSSLTMCLTDK